MLKSTKIVIMGSRKCSYTVNALNTANQLDNDVLFLDEDEEPEYAFIIDKYKKILHYAMEPLVFYNGVFIGGDDEFQIFVKEREFKQ